MITDKLLDGAVESLSKRLRVENEVREESGSLHLDTHIMVGSRKVYSHSLDLSPLLDELESRLSQTPAETMKGRVKVSKIGIPQEDIEHHSV